MTPMTPMIPPIRAMRPRQTSRANLLWMAALLSCSSFATAQAMETPTALASVASATPQFKMPEGQPQKLTPQPPPTATGASAASGATTARGEGRVAADRPVAFLFRPETAGLYSIGVSSPHSAARIAIFLGDSTKPETGTAPADGAIRWSSDIAAGATVKIVVLTAGMEIPFLVEASSGPGGL